MTTIYLLLVAIASEDENFKSQFSKLYFKNSKSFIEYRVCEASLLFLNQSITYSLDKKEAKLEEQYWYYNFYKNDKTIQSIISNLKMIKDFLTQNIEETSSFKEYVLNHVQFWYFDTNISEQGEELYIYMNTRGERMQSNENLKSADVTQIIMDLQAIVSDSVAIQNPGVNEDKEIYVDLSSLDFDKLRQAFAKTPRKNTLVFNLQEAIEQRLEQMLKENPLRIAFYERYKEIIEEYNKGKSLEDIMKTFDNLNNFIKDLSFEEQRVVGENLKDQETLAIFDLLKEGKELSSKELKEVKKVASKTLEILKEEKLKIDNW